MRRGGIVLHNKWLLRPVSGGICSAGVKRCAHLKHYNFGIYSCDEGSMGIQIEAGKYYEKGLNFIEFGLEL